MANNREISAVTRERKTILAIDDDLTVLTVIRKILEKDYDISLAKSADSAMNILEHSGVDLILLDMEMPTTSGLQFMEKLRRNPSHYYYNIPVIFVTSHGTKDVLVKATKSGANDFIVKPIAPRIMQQKVSALINGACRDISERDLLLKRLHLMEIACKTGNSLQVEKIAGELKTIKYNYGTDNYIVDICRKALNFDYPSAIKLIDAIHNNNLFELAKKDE